jgi:hypothetical protein
MQLTATGDMMSIRTSDPETLPVPERPLDVVNENLQAPREVIVKFSPAGSSSHIVAFSQVPDTSVHVVLVSGRVLVSGGGVEVSRPESLVVDVSGNVALSDELPSGSPPSGTTPSQAGAPAQSESSQS